MYLPRHFEPPDAPAMHALMRAYPLASVLRHDPAGGLDANHLPLLLQVDADGCRLHGHVPRRHPLATAPGESSVLALFRGPDGYVSPSWYASKADDGRVVPTWNYALVQAHGTLHQIDDRDWLFAHLRHLSDQFEAAMPAPWALSDAPSTYVERLAAGLVGIEITVQRLEGKFKLSQNHPPANRLGVIEGLRRRGGYADLALADLMSQP
jgi:transcriptional regulator